MDFRTVLPKLQPRVGSHLVGGYFSSQETSSPSVQLFRENSRSTTAHSEGINPCGEHRSSQLLWVCLDNELVLSDSAQAPCQPQYHPPGRESDCATVQTTLQQQDGGSSLPSHSWGTRELHPSPCTWCCRGCRRFSCSSRIRGDHYPSVAQAGEAAALGVLPP